jgi:quercetin dioxygenase-like cupin family protein
MLDCKKGGKMPILNKSSVEQDDIFPGVHRWSIVDGDQGAESLSVGDVVVEPGSVVQTHIHPTEEAMVIIDGELEAVIGDQVISVTEGHTVLAPAGVRHGFTNRSDSQARLLAIFPTAKVERTLVE